MMINLTIEQLQAIMPHARASDLTLYLTPLNEAMERFFINTPLRIAAFIAQIAHESGSLRYSEELWGPTQAQLDYGNPLKEKCRELGNDQKAAIEIAMKFDKPVGYLFRGRGLIQLTGYTNYKRMGDRFGWRLVENPAMAADSKYSCFIAAGFWFVMGLNGLADRKDFLSITRRINGGTMGLKHRTDFYNAAKRVLIDFQ